MKKIIVAFILCLNLVSLPIFAASAFVVRNIEVDGLQRIDEQTVESYLPIKRGQVLRPDKTAAIIKALYKTGFFDHISLARSGDTLIIHVIERPTIGQLKITGNNVIPTDKLMGVMKSLDIAEGRVYNPATIDRIKLSLLNQYYELGRYNARIDVTTTRLERNRVLVRIDISEGLTAKIRRITIIGNKAFSERTLVRQLTVTTPGIFTLFTQTDQYSQEKLDASLTSLHDYYLDRGYARFALKSSQVSITPDRKSVYVTAVIKEGQQYRVSGYALTGDLILPRAELMKLVRIKTGGIFSRQDVMDTEKAISNALGDKGYIYATVSLNPTINDPNRTVFLEINIKPGRRVYVRHISFTDNTKTNDEVLRREIQQMEGSVASTSMMDESKRRLNNLPYLRDTQMNVKPVEGHRDLVDVNYKITESNAAELTGRVGYSQIQHMVIGAGINQKNFLGTGKTLGINAETSRYERFYGASYTDPYYTLNGISRSMSISASRVDPAAANLTKSYSMNEYNFSDIFGVPIGQESNVMNRFEMGYGYQNNLIHLPRDQNNISTLVSDFVQRHGRHFQEINLLVGLSRDSRDKVIFPTHGARQAVGLNIFLPVQHNSLRYYLMNYNGAWFHPLIGEYLVVAKGALGYGNSFSNGSDYPFFKNFYAGGIDSVRGYLGNTLGPRDNSSRYDSNGVIIPNPHPTGGNFLANASLGLILPNYFTDSVRTTVFVDGGNVYQTYDNRKYGGTGSGPLRYSTGVQAEWLSPMGPINLSLARAMNPQKGDELEAFQFSLGANFG